MVGKISLVKAAAEASETQLGRRLQGWGLPGGAEGGEGGRALRQQRPCLGLREQASPGAGDRVWAALPGSGWLVSHTARQETPCRSHRPTVGLDGEKGIE